MKILQLLNMERNSSVCLFTHRYVLWNISAFTQLHSVSTIASLACFCWKLNPDIFNEYNLVFQHFNYHCFHRFSKQAPDLVWEIMKWKQYFLGGIFPCRYGTPRIEDRIWNIWNPHIVSSSHFVVNCLLFGRTLYPTCKIRHFDSVCFKIT